MPKPARPQPHVYLLSDVNVTSATDANAPRQFSGVANSGKPFSYGGQRVMVDLSDLEYHSTVPALLEHERSKRAGFGVLSVENHQLMIRGTLLQNEYGQQVADDADAGFPWQMSAHVIAGSEDRLNDGETRTINGQSITGPITILRKCKIPEVSFTPTGVDSETSAVILSDNAEQDPTFKQSPTHKESGMTLEELQQALANEQAKTAELTRQNEALKTENEKLKAAEAQANVDAQLSQAGFSKGEDGNWQGLSANTYQVLLSQTAEVATAMIGDLKLSQLNKPDAPGYLFGEQHKPATGRPTHVQLSDNPLLANAQARANNDKDYI